MLKIGISGTFSTGKSTLIAALTKRLSESKTLYGLMELSTIARRCPFPINKDQTMETSLWIMTQMISAELTAAIHNKLTITDRTAIDVWALGEWAREQGREAPTLAPILRDLTGHWLSTYDLIFRSRIDPAMTPNWPKIPEKDLAFRNYIEQLQERCIRTFDLSVVELPDGLTERLTVVWGHIECRLDSDRGDRGG
jgi:hypothetical protein